MTYMEPGIAHPDVQPPPPVVFYRGARKMTSETKISMDLLAEGIPENHGVTRQEAWKLAKQTATALGLGNAAERLIDVLFSYSNEVDFTEGDNPIVWASNQTLAVECGKNVNAIAKTLSRLTQSGLIIHTDAHCVSRRGRRDKNGRIADAHGISLSPFIMRYHEYQLIVAEYKKRMSGLLSGKSNRTNLIAEIRTVLNAGLEAETADDWQVYRARLDVIREREFKQPEELAERITELQLLLEDCKNELSAGFENDNEETAMETDAANQETSLPVEIRMDGLAKPAEPSAQQSPATEEPESEVKQSLADEKQQPAEVKQAEPVKPPATQRKAEKWSLTEELIEAAVPAVRELLPGPQSWQSYKDMGRFIAREFGSGDVVWEEALQKVGPDLATAIVMLVYQKFKHGPIEKPGAYMRELVKRAVDGELRLSQSYNALARANMAADPAHLRNTGFPLETSIRYTKWYAITKEHIPPAARSLNVDVVANAFRQSMRKKNIDLTNPVIEDRYVNFCRNWKVGNKTIH